MHWVIGNSTHCVLANFGSPGLKSTSVIRLTGLAVVCADILEGTLGQIAPSRLDRLRTRLGAWVVSGTQGTPRPALAPVPTRSKPRSSTRPSPSGVAIGRSRGPRSRSRRPAGARRATSAGCRRARAGAAGLGAVRHTVRSGIRRRTARLRMSGTTASARLAPKGECQRVSNASWTQATAVGSSSSHSSS